MYDKADLGDGITVEFIGDYLEIRGDYGGDIILLNDAQQEHLYYYLGALIQFKVDKQEAIR
jgi:hypothetical protein